MTFYNWVSGSTDDSVKKALGYLSFLQNGLIGDNHFFTLDFRVFTFLNDHGHESKLHSMKTVDFCDI